MSFVQDAQADLPTIMDKILQKLTKLSKIDFYVECFTADL